MSETQTPIHGLGHSPRRKEDDRFIRGKGTYVDDVRLPGMLHMAILRSPLAHARITSIDTSQALALEGVVAVIAETPYTAHDALELIDVEYDPLPPVVDPYRALEPDAPLIREDKPEQTSNHIFHWAQGDKEATEQAFAQADRVVSLHT